MNYEETLSHMMKAINNTGNLYPRRYSESEINEPVFYWNLWKKRQNPNLSEAAYKRYVRAITITYKDNDLGKRVVCKNRDAFCEIMLKPGNIWINVSEELTFWMSELGYEIPQREKDWDMPYKYIFNKSDAEQVISIVNKLIARYSEEYEK